MGEESAAVERAISMGGRRSHQNVVVQVRFTQPIDPVGIGHYLSPASRYHLHLVLHPLTHSQGVVF